MNPTLLLNGWYWNQRSPFKKVVSNIAQLCCNLAREGTSSICLFVSGRFLIWLKRILFFVTAIFLGILGHMGPFNPNRRAQRLIKRLEWIVCSIKKIVVSVWSDHIGASRMFWIEWGGQKRLQRFVWVPLWFDLSAWFYYTFSHHFFFLPRSWNSHGLIITRDVSSLADSRQLFFGKRNSMCQNVLVKIIILGFNGKASLLRNLDWIIV